ncbi:hypothetical protein CP533_6233 [Ophiocordyceps camponoti-saundersi (nom. inval.)]|nr:hypothetical protein CP533_6233 [Ophiocordyceps camponoti-saundersi (nom. inval.)]
MAASGPGLDPDPVSGPGPDDEDTDPPSYVDYETFLAPDFSPAAFANSLVIATNNPNDSPLDLSTPLSRVLFDAQELDTHIDLVATRHADTLLKHTQAQNAASQRIFAELDPRINSLNESYRQLEKEVIVKHAEADEVRHVALRLWETLRLASATARCLQLGRQLELQHAGLADNDHGALVRCSHTILALREVLEYQAPDEEGHGLGKIDAIRALEESVVTPVQRSVREAADRIVRDLSIPATMTFAQAAEARAKMESALAALYLLSPTLAVDLHRWKPRLLLQAVESYVRSALNTSLTALSRALGQLPTFDRALADVTARCQNLVSLELILESTSPPDHLLLPPELQKPPSLAQPVLAHLETTSLASYFWRNLAGGFASRVQELASRPGAVTRLLRANKNAVGDAIRQAVLKGCRLPPALDDVKSRGRTAEANWDREAAVMAQKGLNPATMAPHDGLVHPKKYDILDSNVEFVGSDIDHRVKYNSAATEPAWNDGAVGSEPGLRVWRIEQFQVVPWPKQRYGDFYDGDSYLVLHSQQLADSQKLRHDIFFWLGSQTTQDEAGTAAYKTVELDEFLHGAATQHREVQCAPSDEFLALFPRISILSGGVRSGFRHVEEGATKDKQPKQTLLRVFQAGAGGSNVVVYEVQPTWRSLDDGDVFVLDEGSKIWVWQGRRCSPMEKAKAAQVVHDMTQAKHVDVEVVSQDEARSRRIVELLGGDDSTPRDGFAQPRPLAVPSAATEVAAPRRLFRLSDASGRLELSLVKEGGQISAADLDGSDVFLLDDAGRGLWVWEGRGASRAEKARWLATARAYVQRRQAECAEALAIPVAKVVEGCESPAFLRAVDARC